MRPRIVVVGLLAAGVAATAPCQGDVQCLVSVPDVTAEDVFLLQVHKGKAEEAFPDLGKLAANARGMIDSVTATADEVSANILITLGNSVKSTLVAVSSTVDHYASSVNQTAGSIKRGVTAILAQVSEIPVLGLQVSENDKQQVQTMVSQADATVGALLLSVSGVSKAVDTVPSTILDFGAQVNATIHATLAKCRDLSASLGGLGKALQGPSPTSPEKLDAASTAKAMLLEMATMSRSVALMSADIVVAEHATPPTTAETMSHLTDTLRALEAEVSAFSTSFTGSFDALSASITDFARNHLSSEKSAEVAGVFAGVSGTARSITDRASIGLNQLFGSVAEGASLVPVQSFGHRLSPGLLAVALGAVAAAFA
mmetsp:Transcript_72863/g.210947  ORF Transcript_72863/g.210947 Transcript_72863/m.210947 type:complete len:371 (+) Transcript_72863:74-1186(+)